MESTGRRSGGWGGSGREVGGRGGSGQVRWMTTELLFALLILTLSAAHVQGLRGCSKFGHSCFGAHGKRTGSNGVEVSDGGRYDGLDVASLLLSKDTMGGGGGRLGGAAEESKSRRIPVNLLRILRNMMRNLEMGGDGGQLYGAGAQSAEALTHSEHIS